MRPIGATQTFFFLSVLLYCSSHLWCCLWFQLIVTGSTSGQVLCLLVESHFQCFSVFLLRASPEFAQPMHRAAQGTSLPGGIGIAGWMSTCTLHRDNSELHVICSSEDSQWSQLRNDILLSFFLSCLTHPHSCFPFCGVTVHINVYSSPCLRYKIYMLEPNFHHFPFFLSPYLCRVCWWWFIS